MRRVERAAVRSKSWSWSQLGEVIAPAMDSVGYTAEAGDVSVALLDLGNDGRVAIFDDAALARRAALALATRTQAAADVYEVVGTASTKRFRFRTAAFKATPAGDLRSAEGKDVNLDDPEAWSGDLDEQADQVLSAFAEFNESTRDSARRDFKKRKPGKASSPRVAALLTALQAAKSHEVLPQPDGRVELRIQLAQGGTQRSFCSAEELDEVRRLLGG